MNDPANILIVEDEKHTRDGLRQLLEDDFEVYVAANAAEAMEHLQNDAIDLLLTDLRLGGGRWDEAAGGRPGAATAASVHHDDGLWLRGDGGGGYAPRGVSLCHESR
jgi:CheY-like chemotaxis protein